MGREPILIVENQRRRADPQLARLLFDDVRRVRAFPPAQRLAQDGVAARATQTGADHDATLVFERQQLVAQHRRLAGDLAARRRDALADFE